MENVNGISCRGLWSAPWLEASIYAVFALGWLVLLLSTFMINHFDLFGLRQVYSRMRGQEYVPLTFTQRAFYKFVRHPIMLGFVIAFWATPHMTIGHLLFSAATTAYIFIGIGLEERDLMRHHRASYADYRAEVPMLFPTRIRRRLNR
jgi:methanethiol S-methyltransferase